MRLSAKEPEYQYTEAEVADRSPLARAFLEERSRLNGIVDQADNKLIKRFYNLDHNTYLEGSLDARTKELMGLACSAVLRCDDCISYHVIQSFRLGAPREQIEESIQIALIIGGSIVVPHMRRAFDMLAELYE